MSRRRGFGHRLGNWLCKAIWWMCLLGAVARGLYH